MKSGGIICVSDEQMILYGRTERLICLSVGHDGSGSSFGTMADLRSI